MSGQEFDCPFSNCSLEPHVDEPAHGYFARLVALEEHDSVRVYANEIGINGRGTLPWEQLETVLRLPLRDDWKRRLQNATPQIRQDGVIMVNGEPFRPRQLSFERRRFCRACLAENAYHRNWWDIAAVTVCPFHRQRIMAHVDDGSDVKWWWPHFDFSPKGHPLREPSARHDPHPSFEGYLLGRTGSADYRSSAILDAVPLHDVIDVCGALGRLLGSNWSNTPAAPTERDCSIGFEAVQGGPLYLTETLQRWIANCVPSNLRNRNYSTLFQQLTQQRNRYSSTLSAVLLQASKKAVAAQNRKVKRPLSERDFDAEDVGVKALSQRLGLAQRAVVTIAERLGFIGERQWNRTRIHFDVTSAEQMCEVARTLVSSRDAANYLGLPKFNLKPLVETGLIAWVAGPSRSRSTGAGMKLIRAEIEQLVSDAVLKVPTSNSADKVPFAVHARYEGITQGELAARVAIGTALPLCRDPSEVGFRSLRFEGTVRSRVRVNSARHMRKTKADAHNLTFSEVEAILGVNRTTVKLLADYGYFGTVAVSANRALVDRKIVSQFASQYGNARVYFRHVGPTVNILQELLQMGVEPIVSSSTHPRANIVVKRTDARRALGLAVDPDVEIDVHLDGFWRALAAEVLAVCPAYKMPPRFVPSGTSVFTSSRKVFVEFGADVGADGAWMSVYAHAQRSPRRWKNFLQNRAAIENSVPSIIWSATDDEFGVTGP